MKKYLALFLAAAMGCCLLAGCSSDTDDGTVTYAVEAGSVGEVAAFEAGYEFHAVPTQAGALIEVAAGTSDACVVDLLMASAMTGEGTSYPDLVITEHLTKEEYVVGCRPHSDLTDYINWVMYQAYADGTMQELAVEYGLDEALIAQPESKEPLIAADGDIADIIAKDKLVVGITEFEPMDYKSPGGTWIGFDADMARLVAQELGVGIEFVVIDWGSKVMELEAKNIDVVWNGMTRNDEVEKTMNCTNAYCDNAQVVVTKAENAQ